MPSDAGAVVVVWLLAADYWHTLGGHRCWWRDGGELGEAFEVLDGGGEQELVAGA
jgi:hypothetical protein